MDLEDLYQIGSSLVEVARKGMVPKGEEFDFASPERRLLRLLLEKLDGLDIGQLAAATGYTQSRVSNSVAGLRERGWVTTEAYARDRRRTLVRLSPQTRRGIQRVFRVTAEPSLRDYLTGMAPEEQRQVLQALELLVRQIQLREESA